MGRVQNTTGVAILLMAIAGCAGETAPTGDGTEDGAVATTTQALHPTTISAPRSLVAMEVPIPGREGETAPIRCATCHELRPEDYEPPTSVDDLRPPHGGLVFDHGELACISCHSAEVADELHLASGEVLPMSEAMQLCGQCHGTQLRDYDHGAHGGMRGYWDLSRGPRERNHCVDCHDPHAPTFPKMLPLPGPNDRFTSSSEADHE